MNYDQSSTTEDDDYPKLVRTIEIRARDDRPRMSNVRQTVTTVTSSTSNSGGNKSNLDALLDDLQSTIGQPTSHSNVNGNVSGYTEVRRTITDGSPGGTSTQYHIEYMHPANQTMHVPESSHHSKSGMHSGDYGSPNATSYKEVSSYKYGSDSGYYPKDTSSTGDVRLQQNISELDSLLDDLHTAQQNSFSDSNSAVVSRNVSTIEPGLLEPVTSTPHSGGRVITEERHYREEKKSRGRSSSPRRELVFTGGRSQDPSPIRHQGYIQDQGPVRQQQVYRYEKTTTSRSTAPVIQDVSTVDGGPQMITNRAYSYPEEPPRHAITQRSPSPAGPSPHHHTNIYQYNTSPPPSSGEYVERVEKVTKYVTPDRSQDYLPRGDYPPPSPQVQGTLVERREYHHNSPQHHLPRDYPPGEYVKEYHREYNTTTRDYPERSDYPRDYPDRREHSPQRYPPGSKTTHVYSYNSTNTSTRETRPEVPRSPPPHRSPSPVAFQQPPPPPPSTSTRTTVRTYHFDQPPPPRSPSPVQKFSPSDPSKTLTYNVSPQTMVTTYKYSSTSNSTSGTTPRFPEEVPLLPRPFPTNPSPSPTPEQQPPKKLDELMASFSDTDIQQYHTHETVRRHDTTDNQKSEPRTAPQSQGPPQPVEKVVEAKAVERKGETKNINGPPVYYPPGELFVKKEESMMQQQSGGGKYKEKGRYEYEASSRSMTKETSGKAVVPVCLPLCCGLPCVIM